MSDDDRPSDGSPPWWRGTGITAGLTALCTVLVALSTFLSAQSASNSDDNYAAANRALTDANFFFEQGVDALQEELDADGLDADRICLLALVTDAAADACDGFDELAALAAADPILDAGFQAQLEADEAAAEGLRESTRSVEFQAALVLFAVGLALSAWAALAGTGDRTRTVFLVIATGATVAGVLRLVTV
ncbi:MAG: hypothetical protein AAFY28_03180 [Actinomycetota bacterium]